MRTTPLRVPIHQSPSRSISIIWFQPQLVTPRPIGSDTGVNLSPANATAPAAVAPAVIATSSPRGVSMSEEAAGTPSSEAKTVNPPVRRRTTPVNDPIQSWWFRSSATASAPDGRIGAVG